MIEIETSSESFDRTVTVQFAQPNGTMRQGDFKATFKRASQELVDEMAGDEWKNSEVLGEVLLGVSGIGRKNPETGKTEELPPDEQLAWVRNSPECVNAAVSSFFAATLPANGGSKTSKKRR
ncbi:MAG TPA: hypothetical protein VFL78_10670 [Rhodanobacteraceae bacterium]|nr:hypothetical protein [Rhodanobacteraceae bacterium]